jgi:hypothetical protein
MIFLAPYCLVALSVAAGLCVALYLPLRRFGRVKCVAIPGFLLRIHSPDTDADSR